MKQILVFTFVASGLVSLLFGSSAQARVFTGYLEKSNKNYYITKNNLKLQLQFLDISISKVLDKLDEDDYLSLEGSLMSAEYDQNRPFKTISVRSINYIGLSDLLGFWKDQNGLCYYFASFTNFKVYIPTYRLSCNSISISRINTNKVGTQYNYFINPDDMNWNMLISNDEKQYLGELFTINLNTRKLITYNSLDGKKLSEVILSRVKNQ